MDTRKPHDIVTSEAFEKLVRSGERERSEFVPLTDRQATELSEATVAERAEWLQRHFPGRMAKEAKR